MVWILPSRSRPHNVARLIAAYKQTSATTPVWLRTDYDDPLLALYHSLELPPGWWTQTGDRVPLSEIYNAAFNAKRQRAWFGVIADDVVPETPEWDTRLIEAAGFDGMAVPSGSHNPVATPHFVLGGGLVRSVGWLALPGLDRLYIDTVWRTIAVKRGTLRRVPEVRLTHHHFSNGLARMDSIYRKRHKDQDRAIFSAWKEEFDGCCLSQDRPYT